MMIVSKKSNTESKLFQKQATSIVQCNRLRKNNQGTYSLRHGKTNSRTERAIRRHGYP